MKTKFYFEYWEPGPGVGNLVVENDATCTRARSVCSVDYSWFSCLQEVDSRQLYKYGHEQPLVTQYSCGTCGVRWPQRGRFKPAVCLSLSTHAGR